MKGYIKQHADFNIYLDGKGNRLTIDQLTNELLADHEHGPEVAALMGKTYRPENLHNNGDICDYMNESRANLARVTHEQRTVSHADLAEQASFKAGQWSHLAQAYQSFVAKTQRWIAGYNPEAIKPDAKFMRKVNEAKLRMRRNRAYKKQMQDKYNAL